MKLKTEKADEYAKEFEFRNEKWYVSIKNKTIMKKSLLIFLMLCSLTNFGQQAIPTEMLFNPRVNKFSISGIGGGNMHELSSSSSSASAQIATDFAIKLKDTDERYRTLVTSFKYNPTSHTKFFVGDTIDMKRIAFIDNQYLIYFGAKYYALHNSDNDENEARWINSVFFDGSLSTYNIKNSLYNNKGFYNFNLLAGIQGGYTTNTDFGIIAVTLSLQGNYINIYDLTTTDRAFDELLSADYNELARNYYGYGGKFTFQINDFAIYLELRRYYSDNKVVINDFSNRAIFSIGGVATGTIFRSKRED